MGTPIAAVRREALVLKKTRHQPFPSDDRILELRCLMPSWIGRLHNRLHEPLMLRKEGCPLRQPRIYIFAEGCDGLSNSCMEVSVCVCALHLRLNLIVGGRRQLRASSIHPERVAVGTPISVRKKLAHRVIFPR